MAFSDVLVLNAGISKSAPIADYPVEDFGNLFATNLRGPFQSIADDGAHLFGEQRSAVSSSEIRRDCVCASAFRLDLGDGRTSQGMRRPELPRASSEEAPTADSRERQLEGREGEAAEGGSELLIPPVFASLRPSPAPSRCG
jgi:NAD(P)-dependent dehydrogenase (short-subunit alcohol dehydrogenase family)